MSKNPTFSIIQRRSFIKQTLMACVGSTLLPTHAKSLTIPGGLKVFFPESKDYEQLNTPFNSDLSFKPVAIAVCRNESDVIAAVNYAREHKLQPSIRSGGHSFIGSSFNDGGLIIDVSKLNQKLYQKSSDTFNAGPGLKLAEVYNHLFSIGRLLPSGSCGGVGLSGITLGGGYGFFSRQHGLTCDHLKSVRMVTANGKVIHSDDMPELLWACRGGGNGHFGVITSMQFSTVKAPTTFTTQKFRASGLSPTQASKLMRTWFKVAEQLPDPIFSAFILNGKSLTILLASTYSHHGPAFQKAKNSLLQAGTKTKGVYSKPIGTVVKTYSGRTNPLPFKNMSAGYYNNFEDIAAIATDICKHTIDHPGIIFQINTVGGVINTKDVDESAYPHRNYNFLGELQSYWQSDTQKTKLMPGVEKIRSLLKIIPHHYVNYPDPKLKYPEDAYYGNNLARLQKLKMQLDPTNFFNQAQGLLKSQK